MAGVSERETTAGTIGRLAIGTATLAKIEGPGRECLPFVKPVLPNLNRFLNRNRNRYEFFQSNCVVAVNAPGCGKAGNMGLGNLEVIQRQPRE